MWPAPRTITCQQKVFMCQQWNNVIKRRWQNVKDVFFFNLQTKHLSPGKSRAHVSRIRPPRRLSVVLSTLAFCRSYTRPGISILNSTTSLLSVAQPQWYPADHCTASPANAVSTLTLRFWSWMLPCALHCFWLDIYFRSLHTQWILRFVNKSLSNERDWQNQYVFVSCASRYEQVLPLQIPVCFLGRTL